MKSSGGLAKKGWNMLSKSLLLCFIFATLPGQVFAENLPTLTIATAADYPPYSFCGTIEKPEDCKRVEDLRGFDIDMANAVCLRIGFQCRFVIHTFETIFENLKKGESEAIFSAVGMKTERMQFGRYTVPYEPLDESHGYHFFARREAAASLDFTPQGLAGRRIGAMKGSLMEGYLHKFFPASKITGFATQDDANQALLDVQIELLFATSTVMTNFLSQHPEYIAGNTVPIRFEDGGMDSGLIRALVSLTPRDPLLFEKINEAILALHTSGHVRATHDRWVKP
jgi:ABC-type amino acid transport substrate-binding protein